MTSFPADVAAPSVAQGLTSVRVCAVIPARGGSKGIPRKNLASVGGVPLVVRAVRSLAQADTVDVVVVSTDDPQIARVAHDAGALVLERPAELATDDAASDPVVTHALAVLAEGGMRPEVTILAQATSPFIDPSDVDGAVKRVRDGAFDVVFSGFASHAFLWRIGDDGAVGVNHDAGARQRRQDRAPDVQETGAFYVMRTPGFVAAGHRFFGRVGVQEVAESTALEIDTQEQLAVARQLALSVSRQVRHDLATGIDAVVTDFDGVHTDDRAVIDQHGVESVTVSRSDGLGIRLMKEAGLALLILSTEVNPVVTARARKLGVEVVRGSHDKGAALRVWAAERGHDLSRVAYVGNDVNDLDCLRAVGWPIAVPDAHPDVLAAARLVLDHRGGHGALRELAGLLSRKGPS